MRCLARLLALLALLLASHAALAQVPGGGSGGGSSASDGPLSDAAETVESLSEAAVQAISDENYSVNNPEYDSTKSPRDTLLTFRENMGYLREGRGQAWPRVKRTLAAPKGMGDNELRRAAMALDRVFDRFSEIRPSDLPGEEAVSATGIGRVEVFPRQLNHTQLWSQLGGAPDGEVVISKGTDGDWQFEAGTVAGADALLDSVKAVPPTYASDGDEVLQRYKAIFRPTWEQTPWWAWLALVGCIVGGVIVGSLVSKILTKLADAAEERDLDVVARVLRETGPPLGLAIFAIAVVFATGLLYLGPTLSEWRWSLARILTVLVIGYALYKFVGVIGAFLARRADSNDKAYVKTMVPFIVEAVRFVVVLIFLAVVLRYVFGVSAGALLTSFGAVGLAVGLAAKESVRNWFGAMTIFFSKPFVSGDWIIFKDEFGQVERVALNATHIRTVRGEVMIVPNMNFIDGVVLNANRRQYLRRTMNLALPYDTTPDRMDEARRLLRDVLNDDEIRDDGHYGDVGKDPHITFQNFNADHLELRAYYWYRIPPSEAGWYDYLAHNDLVNRKVLKAFDDAGFDFAFPTQTLRLADEDAGDPVRVNTTGGDDRRGDR